jgi:transketolase
LENWSNLVSQARLSILRAIHGSGGGHFGGSLSVVEILCALMTRGYFGRYRGSNHRIVLSKGHAAIAYYVLLNKLGYANLDLAEYGKSCSGLDVHPTSKNSPWVDFSTGSLGQGLSVGLGMALALRASGGHVWVVMGDGECQEGQVWEAALLAARYRVSNLHAVIDLNNQQEIGWQHDVDLPQEPLPDAEEKWSAFGWETTSLDGHSKSDLDGWLATVGSNTCKPSIALAKTLKGKGVPHLEKNPHRSHCLTLQQNHFEEAENNNLRR